MSSLGRPGVWLEDPLQKKNFDPKELLVQKMTKNKKDWVKQFWAQKKNLLAQKTFSPFHNNNKKNNPHKIYRIELN